MSDSIDRQEHIKNLVLKTIKTIINQFHRKPDIFFNEHDFHQLSFVLQAEGVFQALSNERREEDKHFAS